MIRLVQRRLIIPRGDTGSFSLPVLPNLNTGNAAVFTIMDLMRQKKIYQKQITDIDGDTFTVRFEHEDTVNMPVGKYYWDIKFYQNPVIADNIVIDGDEIDSYYAAFTLPECEVRQTGDKFLTADDAPTSKLDENSLNLATAIVAEANITKNQAVESASSAANSAEAAANSASAAAQSAIDAQASADSIIGDVDLARQYAEAAEASASAASSSEDAAAASETEASTYASNALNSANSASASATIATEQAGLAEASANAAANSEDVALQAKEDAINAKDAADSYANAAENSANSASSSASSAATSATSASNSATSAATSATTATTQATLASQSATSATNSKNAAEQAKVSAESAQTAAEEAKDNAAASAASAANSAETAASKADIASQSAISANTSKNAAATSAATASQMATTATNAATSAANSATTATSMANAASQSASSAQAYAEHYPKLIDGTWYVWNDTEQDYVATESHIPYQMSDLDNDVGYITSADIPTDISSFNNDVGYITDYTETDPTVPAWAKASTKPTYTAAEVGAPTVQEMNTAIGAAIGQINSFDMVVVQALPTENISTHTIYLVPKTGKTNDIYDEYVYINGHWEMIGTTQIDLSNYVQKTDYATQTTAGVVKIPADSGIGLLLGQYLTIVAPTINQIKSGSAVAKPIIASVQHASTFYGLAKAAGDTTQSQSDNAVGTYTAEAKAAIQQMLDVPSTSDIPNVSITDIQVNGTSIVTNKIANIVMNITGTNSSYGISVSSGILRTFPAIPNIIKQDYNTATEQQKTEMTYRPITPRFQNESTFYGLAKAAGDTTQSQSDNAVGTYTNEAKAAIQSMLGVSDASALNDYALKNNTEITGSLSMGRAANSTIGSNSVAIGTLNTASGMNTVSFGIQTTASNHYAVAEGVATTASGQGAHAEGVSTIASGQGAHAEGSATKATGQYSFANGISTTSNTTGTTVIGQVNATLPNWTANTSYNANDIVVHSSGTVYKCTVANSDSSFNFEHWEILTDKHPLFIIGNGSGNNPSNALQVNKDGNVYVNNNVYVGANADSTGGIKLVSETDYATQTTAGVIKSNNSGADGIYVEPSNGTIMISKATSAQIKAGTETRKPIVPSTENEAVFYGLAKASGDTTQSASSNAVGTYTDAAKTSIRAMLGATSDNVIAVQDTQPTDTDTKIWLPETAETPVQVPTMGDLENYVQKTDYATTSNAGVIKVNTDYGLGMSNGSIYVYETGDSYIKEGTNKNKPITTSKEHVATFYGLAKAAGDTTQAASSNAVGTYTNDAKTAIQTMLDVPSKADVTVNDIQINGTSILNNNIANIPIASTSTAGVMKTDAPYGMYINSNGYLQTSSCSTDVVKTGTNNYRPIRPSNQHEAAFYGLAKAAGDTTQSASSNAVGTYTREAKTAIQTMLGVENGVSFVETISSTTPTITGEPNVRYMCGEVSSISITPPNAGTIDVVFTSGTTAALLTVPSTVKWPVWFNATTLETNTIYEILITDGIYGSVMTWAV